MLRRVCDNWCKNAVIFNSQFLAISLQIFFITVRMRSERTIALTGEKKHTFSYCGIKCWTSSILSEFLSIFIFTCCCCTCMLNNQKIIKIKFFFKNTRKHKKNSRVSWFGRKKVLYYFFRDVFMEIHKRWDETARTRAHTRLYTYSNKKKSL